MRTRNVSRVASTLAVAFILGTPPLLAQAGQGPGMAGGMDTMGQGMGMMQMMGQGTMGPEMMQMMGRGMGMMTTGGPGPAALLRMGDALALTEEQEAQLEAIQDRYTDSVQPHMAVLMDAHEAARAALGGGTPDVDGYEQALRDAADAMVEAHMAMAEAGIEARALLTAEQRERLGGGLEMMQGMMGPAGMGPGTRGPGDGR